MLVCYCVCIGLMIVYWAICARHNTKLLTEAEPIDGERFPDSFQDMTDWKQKDFKYTL